MFAARILSTYGWSSLGAFALSLMPSPKYGMHKALLMMSICWVPFDKIFGLDGMALLALALLFATELVTGIWAAVVRKEQISSIKLSRFGLKVACYLVLIGVSHLLSVSYQTHDKAVPAWVFDWLNVFLVVHISLENFISVLENLAQINGKEKAAWIEKIQEKFNSII